MTYGSIGSYALSVSRTSNVNTMSESKNIIICIFGLKYDVAIALACTSL